MAQTELNIVLKLLDQATADIKKVLNDTSKEDEKVNKKNDEGVKKTNANWLRLSLTIASIIQTFRILSRGISDVIKVGLDMDDSFRQSFHNFNASIMEVKAALAQNLIPYLETALNFWTELLNKSAQSITPDTGWMNDREESEQRLLILLEEKQRLENSIFTNEGRISDILIQKDRDRLEVLYKEIELEQAKQKVIDERIDTVKDENKIEREKVSLLYESRFNLSELSKVLEEQKILFLDNKIVASEYFAALTEGSQSTLQNLQIQEALLRQIANLQNISGNPDIIDLKNTLELKREEINIEQQLAQVRSESFMEQSRQNQEQLSALQAYKENYNQAHAGMRAITLQVSESLKTNLTGALRGIIMQTQSAKEAFADFGRAMIQTILDFMIQKIIASVLEKTLLASTVLSSSTAAATIAAAWAPAAAMVSLATLGGNAAPAAAALASVNALSVGLSQLTPKVSVAVGGQGADVMNAYESSGAYHSGGIIKAHNGLKVDEVPIIAQTGEGILSRRAMNRLGDDGFRAINEGRNLGGDVNMEININYPKMSSKEEVAELANALGFEIEKQLRYARGI